MSLFSAVAVFVKTPGASTIKTRLAATLGVTQALEFYELSWRAVEQTLQIQKEFKPYWAVAEPECLGHPQWQNFVTIAQGTGTLGERLFTVYDSLLKEHSAVFLIGADAPQLSIAILKAALHELKASEFVLGPASDGGFYLFGGRVPIAQEIFLEIPYSQSTTAKALLDGIKSLGDCAILEPLTDVDTEVDFQALEHEMGSVLNPNQMQRAVLSWLRK